MGKSSPGRVAEKPGARDAAALHASTWRRTMRRLGSQELCRQRLGCSRGQIFFVGISTQGFGKLTPKALSVDFGGLGFRDRGKGSRHLHGSGGRQAMKI